MGESKPAFGSWAMLELMGHRRMAGYVSEVEMFGTTMVRLDMPQPDRDTPDTQFYSAAAVYCVTPMSEEEVQKYLRPPPLLAHRSLTERLDDAYGDDDEEEFEGPDEGFDGELDDGL